MWRVEAFRFLALNEEMQLPKLASLERWNLGLIRQIKKAGYLQGVCSADAVNQNVN